MEILEKFSLSNKSQRDLQSMPFILNKEANG